VCKNENPPAVMRRGPWGGLRTLTEAVTRHTFPLVFYTSVISRTFAYNIPPI